MSDMYFKGTGFEFPVEAYISFPFQFLFFGQFLSEYRFTELTRIVFFSFLALSDKYLSGTTNGTVQVTKFLLYLYATMILNLKTKPMIVYEIAIFVAVL
jgi:hypothetical protein